MFVIVSWVSFLIKPEVVPGRSVVKLSVVKQSVVVVVLIANSTFISISPFLCKFQPIIKEGLVIFDISEANQFFYCCHGKYTLA